MLNFFNNLENYKTNEYRINDLLKLFDITVKRDRVKILVKFDIDERRNKFTMEEFIHIFNQKNLIKVICNPSNVRFKQLSDVIKHYTELMREEAKSEVKSEDKAKPKAEAKTKAKSKKSEKKKTKKSSKKEEKTKEE